MLYDYLYFLQHSSSLIWLIQISQAHSSIRYAFLVEVIITPTNYLSIIIALCTEKTNKMIESFSGSNLSPQEIFFACEKYLLPSITFLALLLPLSLQGSIIAPLYTTLLH